MNIFTRLLGVGALALFFSAGASADTLELKDGRVLEGKYLGGTQVIIRFEIQGDVQTFRVREISALTFEGRRRDARDRRDNGGAPQDQNGAGQPPSSNRQYDPPAQDQRPYDQQGNNPPPYDQSRPNDYPPPADSRDRDRYDRDQDRRSHESRDQGRDSRLQPVYAAPGTTVSIPNGEKILVRMIDAVDSRNNAVGDGFHASLESDIIVDNILVARRGSDVYGAFPSLKNRADWREVPSYSSSSRGCLLMARNFPSPPANTPFAVEVAAKTPPKKLAPEPWRARSLAQLPVEARVQRSARGWARRRVQECNWLPVARKCASPARRCWSSGWIKRRRSPPLSSSSRAVASLSPRIAVANGRRRAWHVFCQACHVEQPAVRFHCYPIRRMPATFGLATLTVSE